MLRVSGSDAWTPHATRFGINRAAGYPVMPRQPGTRDTRDGGSRHGYRVTGTRDTRVPVTSRVTGTRDTRDRGSRVPVIPVTAAAAAGPYEFLLNTMLRGQDLVARIWPAWSIPVIPGILI